MVLFTEQTTESADVTDTAAEVACSLRQDAATPPFVAVSVDWRTALLNGVS